MNDDNYYYYKEILQYYKDKYETKYNINNFELNYKGVMTYKDVLQAKIIKLSQQN